MTGPQITRLAMVAFTVAIVAFDVFAWWYFGDEATISRQSLLAVRQHPWLLLVVGGLLGHLFFPQ